MSKLNATAGLALFFSLVACWASVSTASASTTCVHVNNLRICRTPVRGGTRVCITTYLESVSVEHCHLEAPKPPPRPVHHPRSYYLTRHEAVHDMVVHFDGELGYLYAGAVCDLPEHQKVQPGYAYHTWVCSVAAEDPGEAGNCEAEAYVMGTNEVNTFGYERISSNEYCGYGV